jgi:nucleotide-binding universal stress UspA family protein
VFLKRILLPVDFSERSRAALRYAIGLARLGGAGVDLLHVVPPPSELAVAVDAYVGRPLRRTPTALLDDAQRRLERLATSVEHDGVALTTQVLAGDAAATIVQVATDGAHDLIVIGAHGRSGLAGLILGSVTKRLLSCAPCPVVTLRARASG